MFGSTRKGKLSSASIDPKFDSANSRYGTLLPVRRTYQACSSGLVDESRKYGKPDGGGQQLEDAQRGIADGRRFPGHVGQDRQQRATCQQQRSVDQQLGPGLGEFHEGVRVSVSGQQRELEEQQRGGPHRGRASEPGKNDLGDQRLHLEQQECAQENGDGVEDHESLVLQRRI